MTRGSCRGPRLPLPSRVRWRPAAISLGDFGSDRSRTDRHPEHRGLASTRPRTYSGGARPSVRLPSGGVSGGRSDLLAPAYATEAREYLGDLRPQTVRQPWREDLQTTSRVWLYSAFGAGGGTRARFEEAGHTLAETREFPGRLRVDRYELRRLGRSGSGARWSILPRRKSFIAIPTGGASRARAWQPTSFRGGPGGRWVCAHDPGWFYVGPEWHRMGEQLRRCIWAHPPKTGRLEIRFFDVPVAETLSAHGGHTLNASGPRPRFTWTSGSTTGPEQRFTFELEDTWRPIRLRAPTSTSTATLTFAVSSPNNGANHFCFVADTRAGGATNEGPR